jgi:tetratricopeptide (TPR) repeat protein
MPIPLAAVLQQLASADTPEQLAALLPLLDAPAPGDDAGQVMFYKGLVQLKLNRPDAIASFVRSIALNPTIPDARLYYAIALPGIPGVTRHKAQALQRQHLQAAIQAAEDAHPAAPDTWPDYAACLAMYAGVCAAIGPQTQAEFAFRRLLRVDPLNFDALIGLASALIEQGKADDLTGLAEVQAIFEAALALNPADLQARLSLDKVKHSTWLMTNNPGPRKIGRYPDAGELRGDLADVIRRLITVQVPRLPLITPHTRFTAMGSCFAADLAGWLRARGYATTHFELSEFINSTFADRCIVDWAMGDCGGQPKERLDELFGAMRITPDELLLYWSDADIMLYTLAAAPAFFDKGSGSYVMPRGGALNARALAERYEYRTTTVAENLDNLGYIFARLRALNLSGDLRFIIMLSPVPLKASFEFDSAMVADCLSKSTLRVVAHEFAAANASVVYWPSFEIVKWLGAHIGPYYGVDDGASWHVSEDLVHLIADLFVDHFAAGQ